MKEYYKKKELKEYGYDHLPLFQKKTNSSKGYLQLVPKLQVDGEIKHGDLIGFDLTSNDLCFPLFKTHSTIPIFKSDLLPEGYRRLSEDERAKPEALWYMKGFNVPIVKKEIPFQKKTKDDHLIFYTKHSFRTLQGVFTKNMLKHFNLQKKCLR